MKRSNEMKIAPSRFLIDWDWSKAGRYSKWRYLTVMLLGIGFVFGLQRAQIYQAQDQNPTAILHVGDQQNVGYEFCVDGADSHSASTDHFTNKDDITNFIWDFGDGTTTEQGEYLNTHTHSYSQPGTYTIMLTVMDKNGLTDSATRQVTVKDLPKVTVSGNTTSAISSAISRLNGQPGIVHVPAGDYRYDETIKVPSGVIIEGSGMDKTRLHINTNSSVYLMSVAGNNIRITSLKLEGYTTQTSSGINNYTMALYTSSKKNLYIDHCEIMAFRRGIVVTTGATATVEHSNIHHHTNADGYGFMTSRESYVMIRYDEFSNNRHSIASGGCGSTACPTRYDFLYNYVHGKEDVELKACDVDMHTPGHGRIRVIGNIFEDVSTAVGLRDGLNVEVKHNTFRNLWVGFGGGVIYTHEPYMTDGSSHDSPGVDGLYVEDNIFENSGTHLNLPFGKNLYVNCRKMDNQVPFKGNIDWNDCPSTPKTCHELNGNICTPQQTCTGNWISASDTDRCCSGLCTASIREDLNEDGVVNAFDLQICINAVLGVVPNPSADVNGDGLIDTFDVQQIVRKILEG
jgi:PKD repeat protein